MEKAAAGLLPETGLRSVLDINNLVIGVRIMLLLG